MHIPHISLSPRRWEKIIEVQTQILDVAESIPVKNNVQFDNDNDNYSGWFQPVQTNLI